MAIFDVMKCLTATMRLITVLSLLTATAASPLLTNSLSSVTAPLLSVLGLTTISASSKAACSAISKGTAKTLDYGSLDPDYAIARDRYWSAANEDLAPACVVFPTTAQEVSDVVLILQNYTDVPFAIKSGGHNPNVGFSSTDGGVLISFSKLATTTYNAETETADVGPGARWGEVIPALEPYGKAVVGGRIGDVGVGGLLLGGGLSFLSGQYGLACDGILNYEVVLSNGSIVNVNSESNVDLFWALKGGGNQFGMVTKFTLRTVPMDHQIWGGTRIFSIDKASALINATHDFTENYLDHKAGIIVTGELTVDSLVGLFVVFFFYDGPSPPSEVFAQFDAISSILDDVKVQSYSDLLTANSAFSLTGLRYLIRGITLPNLPSTVGKDLYNHHFNIWKSYVFPDLTTLLNVGFVYSIAFQPLPYAIPAASQVVNPSGNILGLAPEFGDHMWMEYDISWLSSANDDLAHTMAQNITEDILTYSQATYAGVKNSNYQSGDVTEESYSPIFLNDAMYDQKPFQSYGDGTYDRLKSIQGDYDPSGFFPSRTGGFKFI